MNRVGAAYLFAAVSLAATSLLTGCHGDTTLPAAASQTIAARVVLSSQQQIPIALSATGTVHARETAAIAAQVMGRVVQVMVREGDTVRAGQPLVVLDDAALRDSAAQAKAGVTAAEQQQAAAASQASLAASTLKRYLQLQAQQSVSPQEMDEVSRRAEAAEAQLNAARAQTQAAQAQAAGARTMLGYTRLVAPFAGTVTARLADPGAMAAPGVPLLQIDQAGPLQLQATVDESLIASIHRGMSVPVNIDSAAPLQGTVAEIVPAADSASHSFLVKIDLPASTALHAGMYGSAEFSSGQRQTILVPRSAVVQRGSLPCAYVLDAHSVAQLRYLTLGAQHGDNVEVLSGIAAGEKLVDAPEDRDLAGIQIEVQP